MHEGKNKTTPSQIRRGGKKGPNATKSNLGEKRGINLKNPSDALKRWKIKYNMSTNVNK